MILETAPNSKIASMFLTGLLHSFNTLGNNSFSSSRVAAQLATPNRVNGNQFRSNSLGIIDSIFLPRSNASCKIVEVIPTTQSDA